MILCESYIFPNVDFGIVTACGWLIGFGKSIPAIIIVGRNVVPENERDKNYIIAIFVAVHNDFVAQHGSYLMQALSHYIAALIVRYNEKTSYTKVLSTHILYQVREEGEKDFLFDYHDNCQMTKCFFE